MVCVQGVSADNPVLNNSADPHVMIEQGTVYAYPTGGRRLYVYTSDNFAEWKRHGPIIDYDKIDWIPQNKGAWAPCIAEKGGKYYLYYSAGPAPSAIGVAEGDSPLGPFKDRGSALLEDAPGFEAIDPMVFRDPQSGIYYFYAGGSAGSKLRCFELEDDMMHFKREIMVDNPPNFTEGVFMHYYNNTYYLSYSHGSYNRDSYSVHYATASSPTGPWDYKGEILKSDNEYKGPGHHSFVENPADGKWYIFYHRWEGRQGDSGPYKNADGSRKTAIEPIEYDSRGRIKSIEMTSEGVGAVSLLGSVSIDRLLEHADSGKRLRYDADDMIFVLEDGEKTVCRWKRVPAEAPWFFLQNDQTGKRLGVTDQHQLSNMSRIDNRQHVQWELKPGATGISIIHRESGMKLEFNDKGTSFQLVSDLPANK
ncbi:MAG: family 43 glycosylhydrolase [Pontiellaceae bacterium]|nr:family 43 glycosylhydrolase [Pontiellaceae bacterium]MBN2784474.1 family 43 glycosylhydrolase [Pontiellaceae bacterium]